MRMDLCSCDPYCARCGRQFIPARDGETEHSSIGDGDEVCEQCIEKELSERFSEEFLDSLSGEQLSFLIRDISRRLGREGLEPNLRRQLIHKEAAMVAKAECEQQGAAVDPRLLQLLREKRLTADPNFYILAIYYSNLKEGGDGELMVKLLKGKMTIKGATYLRKVVAP